ncbi:hypothetical protein MNBD_CPR01-182 [hydrothermal vent metagenome]|uniref:DUF6933 domain-containing protein n=1 Tax=hydrothermal vent metagenome TaxID=652676 RepID=A0A3B0UVV9_9ZZZZ
MKELKTKATPAIPLHSRLGSWHANMFYIERRKCVLVTNDLTLYTMFIPYLRKEDFKVFHIVFGQNLFKNLLYEKISQKDVETVLEEYQDIQYAKTDSRSVLGSMNDQKYQLEYIIYAKGGLDNTDIYQLNSELNRNILSAIKYRRPIEMLKDKLQKNT